MIPKKNLTCTFHNSSFTNFCISDSCISPLCPACIGEHNSLHDKMCTKSYIVMFQQAVTKIQQEKDRRTEDMSTKLNAMKNNLMKIKKHPDQIRATIAEAKRSAIISLETLFSKLQSSLLKQHEKQSYKSVSQLTKLISSIEQFLSKFANPDLEGMIMIYKMDKQKDAFKKSQSSIFENQREFTLEKLGINQFSYNNSAQLCLRQFVEKCLVKNRGKQNECFALTQTSNLKRAVPESNILDIKSSTSKYYGEPAAQSSYSFSERINEKSLDDIKDSSINLNQIISSPATTAPQPSYSRKNSGFLQLEPTGELKFPTLDFELTPGFSLMRKESLR